MPLIFAELAFAYPPQKVYQCGVACRGCQRSIHDGSTSRLLSGRWPCSGGPLTLLEDIDLAFLLNAASTPSACRYAPDALSTRMYRSFAAMLEGWTKNLARLFWLSFEDGGR